MILTLDNDNVFYICDELKLSASYYSLVHPAVFTFYQNVYRKSDETNIYNIYKIDIIFDKIMQPIMYPQGKITNFVLFDQKIKKIIILIVHSTIQNTSVQC